MAKAMNLDTSQRYYSLEPDVLIIRLPENCTPSVLAESSSYMKHKFSAAVDGGISKTVIDIHALKTLHIGVIKLLFQAMQVCNELGMQFALIGNPQVIAECKGFEDTRAWAFFDSVDEAKASFGKAQQPAQLAGT
jgi:two-component system cell cycle response regulator